MKINEEIINSVLLSFIPEAFEEKDPTEVSDNMQDDGDIEAPPAPNPEQEQPEQERLTAAGKVSLIDLLSQAFVYSPDANELKIVDAAVNEFGDSDPIKVADTIERLLQTNDGEFVDDLELDGFK